MKLFYVTARKVYGVYELAANARGVRAKYRGERGLRVRLCEVVPLSFWESDRGYIGLGRSQDEARASISVPLHLSPDQVGQLRQSPSRSLRVGELGLEYWQKGTRMALWSDASIALGRLEADLNRHNLQVHSRTLPKV